ncbi:type-2 ice-structuring protein-like isoform 2-T2 [Menidia menidia]
MRAAPARGVLSAFLLLLATATDLSRGQWATDLSRGQWAGGQRPRASGGTPEQPSRLMDAWTNLGARSFLFVPNNLTWAGAEKNCLSLNANLASVHSPREYQFVRDLVKLVARGSPRTWIGASDCQEDDVWLWSDGTGFDFSLWADGQPDHSGSCTQINVGKKWDDTACSSLLPSVCARPV